MKIINRTLVLVTPKQPYIDWIRKQGDEFKNYSLEQSQNDGGAYLYEDFEPKKFPTLIEQNFKLYFEDALSGHNIQKCKWPQERKLRDFYDWFCVTYHSVLEDMCDVELKQSEL